MLVPDEDVAISRADLDDADSGRDESGVMHRIVIRERVKNWSFNYSFLSAEEYLYIMSLLEGKADFDFTYRDVDGTVKVTRAYCSNDSIVYHNARLGRYMNLKFKIIEC